MTASGPDERARVARRQIVLADVQAGFEQHGEIGAVVDDQECAPASRHRRATVRAESKKPRLQCPLVPDLQDSGAALQKRGGGGFQRDGAAFERFRIENRVDPGKPHG